MTYEMLIVVCVTIVILAIIASIVYIIALHIEEKGDRRLRDELMRLQKQCNEMYRLYLELKDKDDK